MIQIRMVMSIVSLDILGLGLNFFLPSKADSIILYSATTLGIVDVQVIYHYSITCDIAQNLMSSLGMVRDSPCKMSFLDGLI